MFLYFYGIISFSLFSTLFLIYKMQQIFSHTLIRLFHSNGVTLSAQKSLLATLRKKTGYTFSNCKKALEMHDNDIGKAEAWLKEQAKAMGWSKATKLDGRQTKQGLIGVSANATNGVLVEVNCETDFVARNKEFEKLVEEVTAACLDHIKNSPHVANPLTKVALETDQLKSLKGSDGVTLADKLALMIGLLGENASLKRAECIKINEDMSLSTYAHPFRNDTKSISLGRVAGLVALKPLRKDDKIQEVGREICQHVVGMAPKKIGDTQEPHTENKDEEVSLVHQEFLLDDTVTVKEVLDENNVEVVYFKRFECGEDLSLESDKPLQIRTCE